MATLRIDKVVISTSDNNPALRLTVEAASGEDEIKITDGGGDTIVVPVESLEELAQSLRSFRKGRRLDPRGRRRNDDDDI